MQIQRFYSAPVLKFMLEAMPWEKHELLACIKMKTLGFYLCTLMHGTEALCASKNKNHFLSSLSVWGQEEQRKPCHREEQLSCGFVGLERMGLDLGLAPVLEAVQEPPLVPPLSMISQTLCWHDFSILNWKKWCLGVPEGRASWFPVLSPLTVPFFFFPCPWAVRELGIVKAASAGWCFKSSPS